MSAHADPGVHPACGLLAEPPTVADGVYADAAGEEFELLGFDHNGGDDWYAVLRLVDRDREDLPARQRIRLREPDRIRGFELIEGSAAR